MPDKARKETDKELNKMEKHIYKVYSDAADDISTKWYKYMQSHEAVLSSAYGTLQEAKKSGDRDAIKKAQDDYARVVKNVTLNNDRYNAMLNETTAKLAHTNEIALDYVNGNMPKIYTLNYNEFANQDIDGYTFTLVNEQTVKNLATEDKSLLPKKKLDIPKDKQWNQKNINSEVLQGILQGESITKIANRLGHVTDMNRSSAIRNARTMVTGAENKGRQDSFKKAQDDGVIMEREWVATNDERTRAWHADLDGVRVGIDEPWENEYGEIMYPGDPVADPANVYNCRCSIRAHVKGFKWNKEEEKDVEEEINMDIPEQVKVDIQEYVDGTGENFTAFADEKTIDFVKEHMEPSDDVFYRVEQARFTADKIEDDDIFTFKDDIRSFSGKESSMYDILNQSEDIDPNHEYIVFETSGTVRQFPVDKYIDHNEYAYQYESLLDGEFKVINKYYDDEGTLRIVIKQIRR